MTPFYEGPHFVFRFTDDLLIPRFHINGPPAADFRERKVRAVGPADYAIAIFWHEFCYLFLCGCPR
jgi:hypothetical protein